MLGQLTCQINSKENAQTPPLSAFLPYPQAAQPTVNIPFNVLVSLLTNRKKLDPLLSAMLDKEDFITECSATYYWLSSAWMYDD